MEHTPGPWTVHNRTGMAASKYGKFCIASHVYSTPNMTSGKDAICSGINEEANARLIAAAPELLEALEVIANPKNWIQQNGEIIWNDFAGNEFMTEHAMDIARAAIAKAKGE